MVRKLIFLAVLASVTAGCVELAVVEDGTLSSHRATAFLDRGKAFRAAGDYDSAITDFNKVIQLMPNDALPYLQRGLALKEEGKKTEAIADLKKSIELTSEPDLQKAAEQALSELGAQ